MSIQQGPSPSRSIQWGFYIFNNYRPNYNLYVANVSVGGVRQDTKSQAYEPHGSLPHSRIASGSLINIIAVATGSRPRTFITLSCTLS